MLKLTFTLLALVVMGVAGFGVGRLRAERTTSYLNVVQREAPTTLVPPTTDEAFQPYRILQRDERVYPDGRIVVESKLETFTSSEGSMRQINQRLDEQGNVTREFTQYISPSTGVVLIYPKSKTYETLRPPTGRRTNHNLPEALVKTPGFVHTKVLIGGLVGYVRRTEEKGHAMFVTTAPETGIVILESEEERKNFRLVRRLISIEPSDDRKAHINLAEYKEQK